MHGLSRIEALGGFGSVRFVIVGEFGFAEPIVCFERVVRGIVQYAVELERANIRSILKAQAVGVECRVQNTKSDLRRLGGHATHEETVFATGQLGFESNVLNIDAQCAPPDSLSRMRLRQKRGAPGRFLAIPERGPF